MKPPAFAYADPRTIPEALDTLAEFGEDAKILAGGQSLVPLLNMRLAYPRVLIDLNRIPGLQYIRPEERAGVPGVAFGAMTRQRAVEYARCPLPLLQEGIGYVGHPQIRNRGTLGGSIAHGDPAAELPLVFCALNGVATIRGKEGERRIPAGEFYVYTFTTSLEPHDMLTEVWFPLPAPRTGQAFLEVARRHGDFALVAVAVSLTLDNAGRCADVRIAIGGAAPVPLRARRSESMVQGEAPSLTLFERCASLVSSETDPPDDVHADAGYRRDVAGTLVYRALQTAWERSRRDDA